MVLLKNERSLSDGDNHRWQGHSVPTCCLTKIELFALSGGGDTKTLGASAHTNEPPDETFPT